MTICHRIGLVSNEELIAWVDEQINVLDDPPNYLFHMSLGDSVDLPELDLARNDVTDDDCTLVVRRILDGYREGTLQLSDIGGLCFQLAVLAS